MTAEPLPARSIATSVHGRYLLSAAVDGTSRALLVGFHGYAESAERHMTELARIPLGPTWARLAVQGLHAFYNSKTDEVVASWMTRLDRDLAIADNVRYIDAVVVACERELGPARRLVHAGFSQGVAMAYRAAGLGARRADGLIALAGDLPPDIEGEPARRLPPTLIGRGRDDAWYTQAKLDADVARLRQHGVPVETCLFDGGHVWGEPFIAAAGAFLAGIGTDA